MLLMIIKGIFRRYERWNPVHPTLGTFWGIGIGIGCGVGWGPGFGPEVIGYVGAGCGVGFSVGATLAGIGIGLPVNGVMQVPYNARITSSSPLELARSNAYSVMGAAGVGLKAFTSCLSFLRKETLRSLSSLMHEASLPQPHELSLNKAISNHIRSTMESFQDFRDRGWPPWQASLPDLFSPVALIF